MKKIKFSCLNCDAKLRVPTHLAGVSAPCPKCGNTITAPMEIDDAVEEVVVKRQRTSARSSSASRSHSANVASGGAAIAEPPQTIERPRREPTPADQPAAEKVEPQLPEPAPQPIVTETFLKPVADESLPAPVMLGAKPAVEAAPPVFPGTLPQPPVEAAPPESEVQHYEEPPTNIPPGSGHFSNDGEPGIVSADTTFSSPESSVEELQASEPPPLPKTQPIRTLAREDNLPPLRSTSQGESGELPRLDVGLAGESNGVALPGSVIEGAGIQGKTKLRLPQPGEDTKRFTPADFIAPAGSPDLSPPEEPIEQPIEQPAEDLYAAAADETTDESYQIVDPAESFLEPTPQPLENLETIDFEETPSVAPVEETVSEAPPGEEPVLERMPWETGPEAAPEPIQEKSQEEPVNPSLDEGSFENLFAQQAANAPALDSTSQSISRSDDFLASNDQLESPVSGLEAQPVVRKETRSDNDVLEEMFGSAKQGSFRPKKSTLIIAGVVVLLTVIAVTVVIFAASALGFWGEGAPTSMDPVTVAPESMRPKEPEPEVSESPKEAAASPEIEGAAGATDPGVADKTSPAGPSAGAVETAADSASRSTLSLPGDTAKPVRIVDSSVSQSVEEPVALPAPPKAVENTAPANEPEALSFDERVQNIVNGNGLNADTSAAMNETVQSLPSNDGVNDAIGSFAAGNAPTEEPVVVENYNPPEFFKAPGPDDGPLGKTHDLIDAFLRAPDWKTRSKYVYQAESLAPAIEEYYKKWPDNRLDRFSLQLFQMEEDPELGGPYWVYLVSTSDTDSGFPLIVRSENGNLKVDWEIHSEFFDEHFVKFQNGGIAAPQTFRLVIERVTDYYGPDRDQFTDLSDYNVYQINPPYGDLNEFSEYAFVKSDSEIAAKLDEVVGLGEEPLAVIVTLDYQAFPHGVKHLTVTDYVTEGWFR